MLKPIAFGNAFAAIMALFGLAMWLLSALAPAFFKTFWNAQFLGADAARVLPPHTDPNTMLVSTIVFALTGWVMGYAVAYFYNRFAK